MTARNRMMKGMVTVVINPTNCSFIEIEELEKGE